MDFGSCFFAGYVGGMAGWCRVCFKFLRLTSELHLRLAPCIATFTFASRRPSAASSARCWQQSSMVRWVAHLDWASTRRQFAA